MAKKEVSVSGGKIIVVVGEDFDVYEKSLPEGLDSSIDWLGNFGISEVATKKKLKGKVAKYEIQTPDREGKKLCYWNGVEVKEVPGQATKEKEKKKFRTGELDLGDPPVGWVR